MIVAWLVTSLLVFFVSSFGLGINANLYRVSDDLVPALVQMFGEVVGPVEIEKTQQVLGQAQQQAARRAFVYFLILAGSTTSLIFSLIALGGE